MNYVSIKLLPKKKVWMWRSRESEVRDVSGVLLVSQTIMASLIEIFRTVGLGSEMNHSALDALGLAA